MDITIPPITLISARLKKLGEAKLRKLAEESGVPFGTLNKIKFGYTTNPGIETVRKFFPLLPAGDKGQQAREEDEL